MVGIADIWNKAIGGDERVLRKRLEGMTDKPYAQPALAKLEALNADGTFSDEDKSEFTATYVGGLRDYMKTLPQNERFAAMKEGIAGIDANNEYTPLLDTFDAAPPEVQMALANAVTANPHFMEYISEGGANSLGGLLTKEVLSDPNYAGPLKGILNNIANNPAPPPPEGNGYDFKKLDKLGVAANEYFSELGKSGAERNEELIRQRQKELFFAVRDAGGNIPAMANLNGEMLMQFLRELMTGDMNSAITNLASGLGLSGDKLADFQDLMQMPASILKIGGQDGYEFAQHYFPAAKSTFFEYKDKVQNVMSTDQEEYRGEQHTSADIVLPTQHAALDISGLKFNAPIDISGKGLGGVSKMTDGSANDFISGNRNITDTPEPATRQAFNNNGPGIGMPA